MGNRFHLFSWNESLINKTNSAMATAHFDPGLKIYNVCSTSLYLGDKVLLCMVPVGCLSQQDSYTCWESLMRFKDRSRVKSSEKKYQLYFITAHNQIVWEE